MKIAILHAGFYEFGGAERVIINLAKSLKKRGHLVEIFASGFSNKEARNLLKSLGIVYHSLPITLIFDLRHNYKIAGWLIRNYFKGFDVINVHNHPAYIWLYYAKRYAKYKFPKKIIWTCHEPPKDLYPDLLLKSTLSSPLFVKKHNREFPKRKIDLWIKEDKKAISDLNIIYCNSVYIQKIISQIYEKLAIPCHFGIDLERWTMKLFAALPKNPTIVALSRIELAKNFDNIIKAIALSIKKDKILEKTLKLIIGGTGTDLERLKRLVRDLKLENTVNFSGFINEKDIPSFFMQGSFIIFLPLDEPMGLIPIEAGYFGRATLGSNQGGIPEIVKNGVTGLLANPLDIEEISEKIIKLCNERPLAEQLGQNAKKAVINNFDFERFVNLFEKEITKGAS